MTDLEQVEQPEIKTIERTIELLEDKKGAELALKFLAIGKFELTVDMARDLFILETWLTQVASK